MYAFIIRSAFETQGTRNQANKADKIPTRVDIPVGQTISRETVNGELYGVSDSDESSGAEQGRALACKGERGGRGSQPSGLSLSSRQTVSAKALRWQEFPCGGSGRGGWGLRGR